MAILACQLSGFLPRVTQEATQVQTVLSLVESGLGVAMVPAIAEATPNPRIAFRRIVDYPAAARIGLSLAVRPALAGPTALRFAEIASRAVGQGPA